MSDYHYSVVVNCYKSITSTNVRWPLRTFQCTRRLLSSLSIHHSIMFRWRKYQFEICMVYSFGVCLCVCCVGVGLCSGRIGRMMRVYVVCGIFKYMRRVKTSKVFFCDTQNYGIRSFVLHRSRPCHFRNGLSTGIVLRVQHIDVLLLQFFFFKFVVPRNSIEWFRVCMNRRHRHIKSNRKSVNKYRI